MPVPACALTARTRGCHALAASLRRSVSISRISAAVCAASGRSPLLTARMSAISSVPALIAWTSSPSPGGQTTTRVSASATIAVSDWPVPTVSTITRSKPQASKQSTAARVARERPPSSPRAENERMKTFVCAAFAPMRMRSPSTAPPLIGLDGSMATTAIVWPCASQRPSSASTSVDLPLPGTPVMPTTQARPARPAIVPMRRARRGRRRRSASAGARARRARPRARGRRAAPLWIRQPRVRRR